jgi:hypothetical protein
MGEAVSEKPPAPAPAPSARCANLCPNTSALRCTLPPYHSGKHSSPLENGRAEWPNFGPEKCETCGLEILVDGRPHDHVPAPAPSGVLTDHDSEYGWYQRALKAEVEDHRALCEKNDRALRDRWFEEKARADAAEARVAALLPLATFGKAIIESFNDGDFGGLDGDVVQEKAVEIGLLVHPEVAHDPDDCEGCSDEPRSCYVLSEAATALEEKP